MSIAHVHLSLSVAGRDDIIENNDNFNSTICISVYSIYSIYVYYMKI